MVKRQKHEPNHSPPSNVSVKTCVTIPQCLPILPGVLDNGFILHFLKTHSGGRTFSVPRIMIRCIIQPLVPVKFKDFLFAKLRCDESLLVICDLLSAPLQLDRCF